MKAVRSAVCDQRRAGGAQGYGHKDPLLLPHQQIVIRIFPPQGILIRIPADGNGGKDSLLLPHQQIIIRIFPPPKDFNPDHC